MGKRLFLITDAVTEAKTDSYEYILDKDRYVTENGTLAGSCLTLGKAVKNLIDHAITYPEEALRMASLYPARVAGKANQLGRIAPGYQADMVVMDKDFNVQGTIISGKMK
jgi:N-acetylglucosamine-6-phosphate deacetylase